MADSRRDFFITYNRDDANWATWIARVLEGAGYTVIIQVWDSRPGTNFMTWMKDALTECRHALGVMSPRYLASAFAEAEWTAAYLQTLTGKDRAFIPVRVAAYDSALLAPITYIDLVGIPEDEARRRLLDGVQDGRRGPVSPPAFPGGPSPAGA